MKIKPRKPTGKVSNVWKRKKYGKVKVVRQPKEEPKYEKPKTASLRSMYSSLKKCPSWELCNKLALIIMWYRGLPLYHLQFEKNRPIKSAAARLKIQAEKSIKAGHETSNADEKNRLYITAVTQYEKLAQLWGYKVPLISPSLKKGKDAAKKLDTKKSQVEKRYDGLLTVLSGALQGTNMDVGAVPAIVVDGKYKDRNFDHALNKVLYSRDCLNKIKKEIRRVGFLPVALNEAIILSRYASMRENAEKTGRFLVSHEEWVSWLTNTLGMLCIWLSVSEQAPATLIKRQAPRKKRARKPKTTASESPEKVDIVIKLEDTGDAMPEGEISA